MLRKAASCDVVLQQLLGEVLVHLGCFVGIHGVPKGLVQVCKQNIWDKYQLNHRSNIRSAKPKQLQLESVSVLRFL